MNACLEGLPIIRMDLSKEGVASPTIRTAAFLTPKYSGSIGAAPGLTRGGVPFEGDHMTGCERIGQPGLAFLEFRFSLLAFGDIDADAHNAGRPTLLI
jgi:hypothetical protein